MFLQQQVLILDQEIFFSSTIFGQNALARAEAAGAVLAEENQSIASDLEGEELELTQLRASLEPLAFRVLADAFDVKVQAIRQTQDAKSREISQNLEIVRQQFLQLSLPVLSQVVRDRGAVIILDRRTVFLAADRIDITAQASALFDALVGDGTEKSLDLPPNTNNQQNDP